MACAGIGGDRKLVKKCMQVADSGALKRTGQHYWNCCRGIIQQRQSRVVRPLKSVVGDLALIFLRNSPWSTGENSRFAASSFQSIENLAQGSFEAIPGC